MTVNPSKCLDKWGRWVYNVKEIYLCECTQVHTISGGVPIMKKILSMILCLSMFLVPILTGCAQGDSSETDDVVADTEEVRYPMTLSLWLPTSEKTTDEAIALVEAEINKYTTSTYDTEIELHAINEADYAKAIEDKLTSIDDVKKAQERAKEEAEQQKVNDIYSGIVRDTAEPEEVESETGYVAETKVDEYGQNVTVYPAVDDDQLDIFLVKGYEEYLSYIDEGLVQSLDSEMSDIGKKLYSYTYPHFFEMADIDGLYGIPNNHALGDYQFLLVNKRLVEEWNYSPDELTSLVDCEDFIMDMGALKEAGEESLSGVTPLLGECEAANMIYFNADGNFSLGAEPSILCAQLVQYTAELSTTEELLPQKLFDTEYASIRGMMKRLGEVGYIGDGVIDNNEEFAVGVVTGDHTDIAQYEDDYYVFTHGVPVATEEDVFESVFCVSTYSKDLSRSMEIITLINTDETVRTILQYGVEGIHWKAAKTADGEDTVDVISDDYLMNIVDTGNVYLTYPEEGVGKSYWQHSKQQNIDCVYNPYFGFEYVTEDNKKDFVKLATITETNIAELEACSGSEYDSVKSKLNRNLIMDDTVSGLLSQKPDENSTVTDTIYMQLEMFLKSK